MPNLNITANQIQLTTNMLKSTATPEAWTAEGSDDIYPSANAVAQLVADKTGNIEGTPAADITTDQITAWDAEIGAKARANEAYTLAAGKTTAAAVKSQIEAYGYATTSYVDNAKSEAIDMAASDAKNKADTAKSDAIAAAAVDATARANSAQQNAISEAARDAANKYESKGTAQNIINGLRLSETYEPRGAANTAETNAKNQAKSYTDTAVAPINTAVAYITARVKSIEDAPYATSKEVAAAKQEAIATAQASTYPVGSVLITSTKESPAASVGGEWLLVDKEYKNTVGAVDNSLWTPTMSGSTPRAELSGFAIRANHLIHLTLQFTTKTAISLTSNNNYSQGLGTVDHTKIGGSPNLPMFFGYTGSHFAHATYNNGTTPEGCTIQYGFGATGYINIDGIFNTAKQLPENATIYINVAIPMGFEYMGDSFCDKFYWKRTA